MAAKKINRIFICLFSAFVFLLALILGGINNSKINSYALDAGQENEFFQVELFNDPAENSLVCDKKISYNNGIENKNAFVYQLSDDQNFKINFDFTKLSSNPGVNYENKYALSVSVEFLKGYANSKWADISSNVVSHTIIYRTSTKEDGYQSLGQSFNFNIHTGFSPVINNKRVDINGWGVYRFKMQLNSITAYSDFFIIEPTMATTMAPQIYMQDVGLDKYVFNLVPPHEYNFIDMSTLVWYAYGQGNDGKTYALTIGDITDRPDFAHCDQYLHTNIERQGIEFELPKPDYIGNWSVWCEYKYKGSEADPLVSNTIQFKVGEKPKAFPYIWAIVGVCAAAVLITTIVVIVKVKHEKIY